MSGGSKGVRGWMLAVAGAVSLAPILAVLALQVANAATAAPPRPVDSVLRLDDLQIGYWGALECAPLERAEEPPSELTKFIDAFKPRGCVAGYLRQYRVKGQEPDPPIVGSAVLAARSGAEADAALAVLPLLVARLNDGNAAEEVAPTETIGTLTRLFHLANLESEHPRTETASALVWRSGDVLAGVLVVGPSPTANDRIAAIYAHRQQAHIEAPTPYGATERHDTETALDDPNLPVDVHWLGPSFSPGHGLPSTHLLFAYRNDGGSAAPELTIAYDKYLSLESWTRRRWQRQRRTPVGRLVRNWSCTRATTVALHGGHAVVYAGYRKNFSDCPQRPPSVFLADAYFGNTVVAVNSPACVRCAVTSDGAFNSLRGIKAIVRGLRPRTPVAPR